MTGLLLRADAGPAIGAGHALRCLALGQAWADAVGMPPGAAGTLSAAIGDRYRAEGLVVHPVSAPPGSRADATQTIELAAALGAAWVAVDGYAFGDEYDRALADAGLRVLAIDDDGRSRRPYATIVLNQNLHGRADWYAPASLLGPRFAMIRREFRTHRDPHGRRRSPASRLVITLGGGRADRALLSILEGLGPAADAHLTIDVTADVAAGDRPELERRIEALDGRWAPFRDDMPAWLGRADLAISAAGSTVWELMCLGIPALLTSVAPNQRPVAAAAAATGAAFDLGSAGALDPAAVSATLHRLIHDDEIRQAMSDAGRACVDGDGAARVVQAVTGSPLRLRPAVDADTDLLWRWANDEVTREVSFSPDPIPWEAHQAWMQRTLADPATRLWIAIDEADRPVGQVRFDRRGDQAIISVGLSPSYRGRGLGTALIGAASRRTLRAGCARVVAYVKPDNAASIAAFRRSGFVEVAPAEVQGQRARQFELSA